MSLLDTIRNYKPVNPQEEHDRKQMLEFIEHNGDYLERKI